MTRHHDGTHLERKESPPAAGEPGAAVAEFSYNAAGAVGLAFLVTIQVIFHFVAILAVATLETYFLFRVSLIWSVVTGIVIGFACLNTVTMSQDLGEQYAHQIPLDEKWRGIRSDRDGR